MLLPMLAQDVIFSRDICVIPYWLKSEKPASNIQNMVRYIHGSLLINISINIRKILLESLKYLNFGDTIINMYHLNYNKGRGRYNEQQSDRYF